jgi:hypothetical protein
VSAMAVESAEARPRRISGKTAAEEVAEERVAELDEDPLADDEVTPEERSTELDGLNFARMRLDWRSEDARDLATAERLVDEVIAEQFADAHAAVFELWDIVRDPVTDGRGEPMTDRDDNPLYVMLDGGGYKEDWSRLSDDQLRDLLFKVTTGCYAWEQRAATFWFRAMYSKFRYRLEFSRGYDEAFKPPNDLLRGQKDTIEHRTARAELVSDEDRLFALLQTYASRRADAVVRSMRSIERRISEVLASR